MGNWELAIWPFTLAGNNPAAVYRTVKNPYVDAYLRDLRRDLYPGGLLGKGRIDGSIEEGQKTARLIMDFVRKGGRLGLVCDLHDRTGLPVPFFGKPAKSVTIPAMIARRVGARIWMSRCLRVGKQSRFQIELKELKVPRTAKPGRRREMDHDRRCRSSSRPGSARRPSSGAGTTGAGGERSVRHEMTFDRRGGCL